MLLILLFQSAAISQETEGYTQYLWYLITVVSELLTVLTILILLSCLLKWTRKVPWVRRDG